MSHPKFSPGDKVLLVPGTSALGAPRGVYTVTRVMPADAISRQYRVKSAVETNERVFDEGQLQAA